MSEKISDETKTVKAVEEATQKDDGIFELSSGVVLRTKKKISPSVLIDIVTEVENTRPKPPFVYIEALGREEVNLDDPEYIERLSRWEAVGAGRIADALILLGTEIESIPKGVEGPTGNEWIEIREVLGFKINRRSERARYLSWVKTVAIEDQHDWEKLTGHIGRVAGVTEADVKRAQDSFPNKKG